MLAVKGSRKARDEKLKGSLFTAKVPWTEDMHAHALMSIAEPYEGAAAGINNELNQTEDGRLDIS